MLPWKPNTWRTLEVIDLAAVPGLEWIGDNLSIAWDSPIVAFLDKSFNLVQLVYAEPAGGYSSGVTVINDVEAGEPHQLWLTDFSSDMTTIVDSGFAEVVPEADLAITKNDGRDTYLPGMKLTYTVEVTNIGPDPAKLVNIVDTAPDNTEITGWECTAEGGVDCTVEQGLGDINLVIPLFATGGRITLIVDLQTSILTTGDLTNAADVSSETTDRETANNSAEDTNRQLSDGAGLLKSDGRTRFTPGTTVSYQILAANFTSNPINDFTLTDEPPSLTTMAWTCQALGVGATCPAGLSGSGTISHQASLPPYSVLYYQVDLAVDSGFTGDLSNTVSADSVSFSPSSATDTDTCFPVADLSVTKTDGVDTYTPGTSATYTVTVANAGPSDAANVRIVDSAGGAGSGKSISSWTCADSAGVTCPTSSGTGDIDETVANFPAGESLTYTVVMDIASDYGQEGGLGGTLGNSVSVSGDDHDPDETNNSANDVNSRISFSVSASAGDGGTISPSRRETEHGLTATFNIKPNSYYRVVTPVGGTCGGSYTGNPADSVNGVTYTTDPITSDCTVSATFASAAPVATTNAASPGEATAMLNGLVESNWLDTTAWFVWGTDENYGNRLPLSPSDDIFVAGSGGSDSVDAMLTGLTAATECHYQACAENSAGTSCGLDQTFTTETIDSTCPDHEPIMISGEFEFEYGTFADMLVNASDGDTILLSRNRVVGGAIDFPGGTLFLEGGWSCDFGKRTLVTSYVTGSLTVVDGAVVVDGLTISSPPP